MSILTASELHKDSVRCVHIPTKLKTEIVLLTISTVALRRNTHVPCVREVMSW